MTTCTHILANLIGGTCALCAIGATSAISYPPPTESSPKALAPPVGGGSTSPRRPQSPWGRRALADGPAAYLERVERALSSDDIEDLVETLRQLDEGACRASLHEFVRLAFTVTNPGTELEDGEHIKAVCFHIQKQLEERADCVTDRRRKLRVQDLLVNIPPRSLKTTILTCATVWAWLHWPTLKIMYLSANPRVASASARMARDLLNSNWFRTTFKPAWNVLELDEDGNPLPNAREPDAQLEIRSDQDALSDLGNTAGGTRIARGLASTITGEGCDWLCVARGTLVATEIGDVPIEQLVEMQQTPRVWSMSEVGELQLRNVTGSHRTPNRKTVRVRTDSGHVLRCTPDHRIWTASGYRAAQDLNSGYLLATSDSRRVSVSSVEDSSASDVFDINVEGNHNFFANGILVHNCIDDPHDVKDGPERVERAVEDYDGAVANRLNSPRTAIRTLIMQRVRLRDLAARWIDISSKLLHVRLPMEYETEPECKCGTCTGVNVFGFKDWRTIEGQTLHARFDAAFIEGEKKRLQSRYVGQHQQRPTSAGGQIFKVGWWEWCSLTTTDACARPTGARTTPAHLIARRRDGSLDLDWLCVSVDATGGSTSNTASSLGIGIIGGKGLRRFLLEDCTDGPKTWLQTLEVIRNVILRAVRIAGHQPRITVLVEKKALGQAAIEQVTEFIRAGQLRYPDSRPIIAAVEGYEPAGKGDKRVRAELMEPDVAAGLLHLVDGASWVPAFRAEFEGFPKAPHDDRVDYLSQCLDHYRSQVSAWGDLFRRSRQEAADRLAAAQAR